MDTPATNISARARHCVLAETLVGVRAENPARNDRSINEFPSSFNNPASAPITSSSPATTIASTRLYSRTRRNHALRSRSSHASDCAVHKKLASKSLSATATRATVVRDDPIGATVFLKNARTVAQVELRAASRTASSSYESSRGSSVRQSREKTVCLLSTHLEDEFANGGEGDVDGDARGRAGDASRGVGSVTRACGHRPALTRGVRDVREKFSKCTTSSREETAGDARRDARRCARKRRAE